MPRAFDHVLAVAVAALALALAAGCAANGDAPPGSPPEKEAPEKGAATAAASNAGAGDITATAGAAAEPLATRDVAILTLSQTPSSLHVTSHNRRPRTSFGPAATWNGDGPATHRWRLIGHAGDVVASGDIAVRRTLEVPPDPRRGSKGAHVALDVFSFTAKVPHPEPGEAIEIAPAGGSPLVARWP